MSAFNAHRPAVESVAGLDVLELGPGGNLRQCELFVEHGARSATAIDTIPFVAAPPERVRYLAPCDAEATGLPAASFDLIFSHACFEHVADPERVIAEIRRLLRPGGTTSHRIDLRDHRDFDAPLAFLAESGWTWRLMASNGGGWSTNRWRRADFEQAFRRHFTDVRVEVTESVLVTERDRRSFAREFRDRPIDELGVVGILVVAS